MWDTCSQASLRIIADHSRAATFLIFDGVCLRNEGRGCGAAQDHAARYSPWPSAGAGKPFMHEMVYAVRDEMGKAYPS